MWTPETDPTKAREDARRATEHAGQLITRLVWNLSKGEALFVCDLCPRVFVVPDDGRLWWFCTCNPKFEQMVQRRHVTDRLQKVLDPHD